MQIEKLKKENDDLKNQIKMIKQSSSSLLISPQKSVEQLTSYRSIDSSPLVSNFGGLKKKTKKVKKRSKRKKIEYLNPVINIKVKTPLKKISKSRNVNKHQYLTHDRLTTYNSARSLKSYKSLKSSKSVKASISISST